MFLFTELVSDIQSGATSLRKEMLAEQVIPVTYAEKNFSGKYMRLRILYICV